jgi:hypothetical protein
MNKKIMTIALTALLIASGFIIVGPKTVSAADTITITTPTDYRMYQRNSSDQASITITGTYTGTVVSIEADFNGGGYSVINSTPSGGAYTGTLTGCSLGQGTLTVRFSNNISCTATKTYIGVGDIYVIAGQSNAVGNGDYAQTYSNLTYNATVFREDDAWKLATDPTDTDTSDGSYWPILAGKIMDNASVPIGFITTATGGKGLVSPADWAKGGSGRYENMWNQVNDSGAASIKAVLWHQGETDAYNDVSYTQYYNAITTLSTNMYNDLPGNPKTHVALIGQVGLAGTTDDDIDAVRHAQIDSWNTTYIEPGPIMHDLGPFTDNLHLDTNASLYTMGERWFAILNDTYYSGDDGRGPYPETIEITPDRYRVDINYYNDGNGLTYPGGQDYWQFYQDGLSETANITYSSQTSTYTLTFMFNKQLTGDITVSYISGDDAMGATLITDNTSYSLPAEPIYYRPATNGTHIRYTNTTEISDMGTAYYNWQNDATYNDTFDGEPTGTAPDNWNAGTADTLQITETYSISPSRSMLVHDNSGSGYIYHNVDYTTENISMWVYFATKTGNSYNIGMQDTTGPSDTGEVMMWLRFGATSNIEYYTSGSYTDTGIDYDIGWSKLVFHDNGNNTFDLWFNNVWIVEAGGFWNAGTTGASIIIGMGGSASAYLYIDNVQVGTSTSANATANYTTDTIYIPENTHLNNLTLSHRDLSTYEEYINKVEFIHNGSVIANYTANITTGTTTTITNADLTNGNYTSLYETFSIKLYYWSNTTTPLYVYLDGYLISNYTLIYRSTASKTHGGETLHYKLYCNVSLEYSTVYINETYNTSRLQYHSSSITPSGLASGAVSWTMLNVSGNNIIYLNFTVNNTNTSYNLLDNYTFFAQGNTYTTTSNTVSVAVHVASVYAYVEIVKGTATGYNLSSYGLIESVYSATIRINCSESLGNITWYNISFGSVYQNSSSPHYNHSWIGDLLGAGNHTLTITTSANTTANQTVYIEIAAITSSERIEQTSNAFMGMLPLFVIVLFIGALGDAFITKRKKKPKKN